MGQLGCTVYVNILAFPIVITHAEDEIPEMLALLSTPPVLILFTPSLNDAIRH